MYFVTADHFPVSIAASAGDLTRADVDAMAAHSAALCQRGGRFAILFDSRRSNVPSPEIRRALADMSNAQVEQTKKYNVCTITVLDNKLLIGALTAIRWFLPSDFDLRYVATASAAITAIAEKLAAEGLKAPASAFEFAAKLDRATPDQLAALFAGVTAERAG